LRFLAPRKNKYGYATACRFECSQVRQKVPVGQAEQNILQVLFNELGSNMNKVVVASK
jgi:hypothetical protein